MFPVEKQKFKKLMYLATQSIFIHNDRLYKQIDGVSMGCPLGPTLANYFLGGIEEKIFRNLNNTPVFYGRYIDDVIAIFDDEIKCESFLKILNSQHKNLKFTIEKATNTLNFLDVEVKLTDTGFETRVYRKPTHTGLYLNFYAICPTHWKSNLILCLLHRAKIICSNSILFKQEVDKLRSLFYANSYPISFFNKILTRFEEKCNNPPSTQDNADQDSDFSYIFQIPYLGKPSKIFSKRISNLIQNKFSISIHPYFTAKKIGSYFNLKSPTPKALTSKVVYKFSCVRDASQTYIGMSTRHLCVRVNEHFSSNSSSKKSAIHQHIQSCIYCNSIQSPLAQFNIVKKCNTDFSTKIQEALLIKKLNPTLNRQLYENGCSFLLSVY